MDPALCAAIDARLEEPGETLTDLVPYFALDDAERLRMGTRSEP